VIPIGAISRDCVIYNKVKKSESKFRILEDTVVWSEIPIEALSYNYVVYNKVEDTIV
jgi:hypothetical protein